MDEYSCRREAALWRMIVYVLRLMQVLLPLHLDRYKSIQR